jgi:NADPH-ferrihemoprotein reductase
VYVQHLLLQDGPQVAGLIDAGARVYVCGDGAAMAKDVHAALTQLLAAHSSSIVGAALGSSGAEAAAAAKLAEMTKAGAYVRDIWS